MPRNWLAPSARPWPPRQPNADIVAIPPFVSHDLGYEFEYLKEAYTRLIEQQLLSQAGVLVVELAEAQAISQELVVADAGGRVERPLPLYVFGEYRHEGHDDLRKLAIRLTLKRGDQQLDRRGRSGLSPAECAAIPERDGRGLAPAPLGPGGAPGEPARRSRATGQRAKQALLIGDWDESLALTEAALLLDPHREESHHDAVVALGWLTAKHPLVVRPVSVDEAEIALNYYRRGLEHLEAFLSTAGDLRKYVTSAGSDFIGRFLMTSHALNVHPNCRQRSRNRWRRLSTSTARSCCGSSACG